MTHFERIGQLVARSILAQWAVALALETGPSGKISVEHVVNVLARLNAALVPETAATSLQVATLPLANPARYDSLRAGANATSEFGHDA